MDPAFGKIIKYTIDEFQEIFSDERIKKELDRFMHGMGNRFIPIEAPVKGSKMVNIKEKIYLYYLKGITT